MAKTTKKKTKAVVVVEKNRGGRPCKKDAAATGRCTGTHVLAHIAVLKYHLFHSVIQPKTHASIIKKWREQYGKNLVSATPCRTGTGKPSTDESSSILSKLYTTHDNHHQPSDDAILVTSAAVMSSNTGGKGKKTVYKEEVVSLLQKWIDIKNLMLTHDKDIGCGLAARRELPKGYKIPGIVVIDPYVRQVSWDARFQVRKDSDGCNLYGPMSMLNAACSKHANFHMGNCVESGDWNVANAVAKRAIKADEGCYMHYTVNGVSTCAFPGCSTLVRPSSSSRK